MLGIYGWWIIVPNVSYVFFVLWCDAPQTAFSPHTIPRYIISLKFRFTTLAYTGCLLVYLTYSRHHVAVTIRHNLRFYSFPSGIAEIICCLGIVNITQHVYVLLARLQYCRQLTLPLSLNISHLQYYFLVA